MTHKKKTITWKTSELSDSDPLSSTVSELLLFALPSTPMEHGDFGVLGVCGSDCKRERDKFRPVLAKRATQEYVRGPQSNHGNSLKKTHGFPCAGAHRKHREHREHRERRRIYDKVSNRSNDFNPALYGDPIKMVPAPPRRPAAPFPGQIYGRPQLVSAASSEST